MSLESIDTSYWKTKDKSWKEERLAQWPAIERVVVGNRRKSEVNVIKQYFLRGKMPPWEKYLDWHDTPRHLDLKMFLWLHPSKDPAILNNLYKTYMQSDLVHWRDITLGYGSFLDNELMRATSSSKSLEDYSYPFMGEKNIILFRIMFGDLDYAREMIHNAGRGKDNFDHIATNIFEWLGYLHFLEMRRWLMQDRTSPLSINCLYQYDEVLEWALTTLTENREVEFRESLTTPFNVYAYQKAFYCFLHFDTAKEGDTGRSRFIPKIKKILDENEFIPEFKQMWEDIKAGKIEVKNPWKL